MASKIVKINQYVESLISFIEKLEVVDNCEFFKRQIDFNIGEKYGHKLKINKATVYIDVLGGTQISDSNNLGRRIFDYKIAIYILALNDFKSTDKFKKFRSETAEKAIEDIKDLLFLEDLDLNIDVPTSMSVNDVDFPPDVSERYSISYITYNQRLNEFEAK